MSPPRQQGQWPDKEMIGAQRTVCTSSLSRSPVRGPDAVGGPRAPSQGLSLPGQGLCRPHTEKAGELGWHQGRKRSVCKCMQMYANLCSPADCGAGAGAGAVPARTPQPRAPSSGVTGPGPGGPSSSSPSSQGHPFPLPAPPRSPHSCSGKVRKLSPEGMGRGRDMTPHREGQHLKDSTRT